METGVKLLNPSDAFLEEVKKILKKPKKRTKDPHD
jgi:hypothetical protein